MIAPSKGFDNKKEVILATSQSIANDATEESIRNFPKTGEFNMWDQILFGSGIALIIVICIILDYKQQKKNQKKNESDKKE